MKIAWLALALFFSLTPRLVFAEPAAQGPSIEIRQLGWQRDGSLTPASWNPVNLRVGGSSSNDTLRVQLLLKFGAGPSARPQFYPLGAYGQDVALPPGVEKDLRLWIYVPASGTFG